MRQFTRQGDGNAARTSSNICDSQWLCASRAQPGERNFDQVLSFGPGNQHAGTDLEFQSPKLLPPSQVLSGNTFPAARDQFLVGRSLFGSQFVFGMRVNPGTIAPKNVHQQQFGCQSSGGHIALLEMRDTCSERRTNFSGASMPA